MKSEPICRAIGVCKRFGDLEVLKGIDLDVYQGEELFQRAAGLAGTWEEALHSLKGEPHVIDIRNLGLVGAVELEPIPGQATRRAYGAFVHAYEHGAMTRFTGDTIALSPPLIIEPSQIEELIETVRQALRAAA